MELLFINLSKTALGRICCKPGTGLCIWESRETRQSKLPVSGGASQVSTSTQWCRYAKVAAEGLPAPSVSSPNLTAGSDYTSHTQLTINLTEGLLVSIMRLVGGLKVRSMIPPHELLFSSPTNQVTSRSCQDKLKLGKRSANGAHHGGDLMLRSEPYSTRVDNLEFKS